MSVLLSSCFKLCFSNPYIFSTQCRKPLMFQTMNSVWSNNLSLKYQVAKNRKFKTVSKTLFQCRNINEIYLFFLFDVETMKMLFGAYDGETYVYVSYDCFTLYSMIWTKKAQSLQGPIWRNRWANFVQSFFKYPSLFMQTFVWT